MTQSFGRSAFQLAEQFAMERPAASNSLTIAQQGVAASKELYVKTASAAQDSARAVTEIADTAWGSTKMLNEKIAQNLTANTEAAFNAALAICAAKSLAEAARLQGEWMLRLTEQTTEQAKEFFDLSGRATQHLIERAQAVTAKSFPPLS